MTSSWCRCRSPIGHRSPCCIESAQMPGYDPDEPCVPLSAVRWPSEGPPLIDQTWRTSTVLALARQIVQSGSTDLLPILADALEDAGCDNQYVLNHCRRCVVHLPVCWVTSAVLRNPRSTKINAQAEALPLTGKYRAVPKLAPKPITWKTRCASLIGGCFIWATRFGCAGMLLLIVVGMIQGCLQGLGCAERRPRPLEKSDPHRWFREYRPSTFR